MKKSFFCAVLILIFAACTSDELPPSEGCIDTSITYTNGIKDVIDQTCAYSGCHNGVGNAPGDYSTYEGLRRYLDDGSFTERVIDQRENPSRGMPPDNSVYPESLQDDLSDVQLQLVTCWIQNNFPE